MSSFEKYIEYIYEITNLLSNTRLETSKSSSNYELEKQEIGERYNRDINRLKNKLERQKQDYYNKASLLKSAKAVSAFGIELPRKIRPAEECSDSLALVLKKQRVAEREFLEIINKINKHSTQKKAEQSEAIKALQARKKRLIAERKAKLERERQAELARQRAIEEEARLKKEEEAQRKENIIHVGEFLGLALLFSAVFQIFRLPFLGVVVAAVLKFLFKFSPTKLFRNNTETNKGLIESKAKQLIEKIKALFTSATITQTTTIPTRTIEKASAKGRITGFEPQTLENIKVGNYPLMHGIPGKGLSDSGFNKKMQELGQLGEVNFAKSLIKTEMINRFASFWSIHMLDKDLVTKIDSDVDCAIVTGSTVWLIDLKFYQSGDVTYRAVDNKLYTIDNTTGSQIGKPIIMTKNMKMAVERFSERYHNYRSYDICPRVIFIPTYNGMGVIDDVIWPGNIPAVTLTDFLIELGAEPDFEKNIESDLICETFKYLLK